MARTARPDLSTSDYPVDRAEIEKFVRALFRYADPGTFVQLRAFAGDKPWKISAWRAVPINDREAVIDAAVCLAQQCADAVEKVTFCPPVATFIDASSAATRNLANGLVLLVECDSAAQAARETLELILGPATVVVESGGRYSTRIRRFRSSTCTGDWSGRRGHPEEHERLREARNYACALVGADASGVPVVHPIRWPGSWHRKDKPRLARIAVLNETVEIDLDTALEQLQQAANAADHAHQARAGGRTAAGRHRGCRVRTDRNPERRQAVE